jgi:hypothetical protein
MKISILTALTARYTQFGESMNQYIDVALESQKKRRLAEAVEYPCAKTSECLPYNDYFLCTLPDGTIIPDEDASSSSKTADSSTASSTGSTADSTSGSADSTAKSTDTKPVTPDCSCVEAF